MGSLSTHILDTASGKPAAGVQYGLHRLGKKRLLICAGTTNEQGRTDNPLLSDREFQPGSYELTFLTGAYFANGETDNRDKPVFDEIVIRFRLEVDEHYHIPLLVSPWSYTTYRGS